MALIEDVWPPRWRLRSASGASCFLNGHYDNTYAIAYACANAARSAARPVCAPFPVNYWDGLSGRGGRRCTSVRRAGPARESRPRRRRCWRSTRALVDMDARERRDAAVPGGDAARPRRPHRVLLLRPRARCYRATACGTWGDAREATAEFGERYLQAVTRGTLRLLDDIERTFAAMPPRSAVLIQLELWAGPPRSRRPARTGRPGSATR